MRLTSLNKFIEIVHIFLWWSVMFRFEYILMEENGPSNIAQAPPREVQVWTFVKD